MAARYRQEVSIASATLEPEHDTLDHVGQRRAVERIELELIAAEKNAGNIATRRTFLWRTPWRTTHAISRSLTRANQRHRELHRHPSRSSLLTSRARMRSGFACRSALLVDAGVSIELQQHQHLVAEWQQLFGGPRLFELDAVRRDVDLRNARFACRCAASARTADEWSARRR
jgi:hypothetical protein